MPPPSAPPQAASALAAQHQCGASAAAPCACASTSHYVSSRGCGRGPTPPCSRQCSAARMPPPSRASPLISQAAFPPPQVSEAYGEFFKGIPKIKYEGVDSTNPLAFRCACTPPAPGGHSPLPAAGSPPSGEAVTQCCRRLGRPCCPAHPGRRRYYNADEVIMGKPMKEWLRFSVAFWHTFRGDGGDPFGSPTKERPRRARCGRASRGGSCWGESPCAV
jgi:hypothetical protein